eukprot:TRINITY_DN207_c3_g1_i1.p1 TRINITY_DN207_c3_g1~~TRINITY_DN207_c3_g1_i1.p1  ORF type:complete len:882 (+),score=254.34 TRINITY_DN207_c3_g1_i1:97-2742(+)
MSAQVRSSSTYSAEAYAAMKESQSPEIAEAMRLLSKYTDTPQVPDVAEQTRLAANEYHSDDSEADEVEAAFDRSAEEHRHSELGIVQRELHRVKQLVREQQDELHFARVRLEEKARQLGETSEELRMVRMQNDQSKRRCDDLQRTCHAQYTQNLELQYAVERSSSGDFTKRLQRQAEVNAGFQHQKELTLRCMRLRKRLRETRVRMADKLALQEQQLMFQEDPENVASLLEAIRQRDEQARKERERWLGGLRGAGPGRSSLMNVNTRHSAVDERSEASWDLPKHKTALVTTEDKYIDCKIARSGFRDPLRLVREQLYPIARDFKESSDKAVTELWFLYNGGGRSIRPKEDFYKKTSGQLTRAKVLLAEMLRRINTVIKAFLKEERDIKERWLLDNIPTNHCETQADLPGPPDPLIEEQAAEIKMLRDRLERMRQQTTTETNKLSLAKEKAELNLQFLQGKLFSLHREMYTSLHLVYKHRYKWIARFPDPLRDLKLRGREQKLALDLQFNLKLGQILDRDVEYLKTFGQYFTSDETFGVDMSTHAERDAAVRQASRGDSGMFLRRRPTDGAVQTRRESQPPQPGSGSMPPRARRPTAPFSDSAGPRERRLSLLSGPPAPDSAAAAATAAAEEAEAEVDVAEPRPLSDDGLSTLSRASSLPTKAEPTVGDAAGLPDTAVPAQVRSQSPSTGRRMTVPPMHPRSSTAHPPAAVPRSAPARVQSAERRNTLPPASLRTEPVGADGVTRMESWRRKQQQIWEGRRREHAAIAKEQIPYVAARAAMETAQPLSPPGAIGLDDVQVRAAQEHSRRTSEEMVAAQVMQAAPAVPPSRDTIEVFNRIILRRRNLPLRPTKEPNLQEGAYGSGYLLEGNKVCAAANGWPGP